MKPKTKNEREVAALSSAITTRWQKAVERNSRMVRWIQDRATPNVWRYLPYQNRIKDGQPNAWCTACCHSFRISEEESRQYSIRCPRCGRKLYRGRGNKKSARYETYEYVVRAEVHGEWQLLRYFFVMTYSSIADDLTYSSPIEVVRRWMRHGCPTIVESVGMVGMMGYRLREIPFNLNAPLSLKREGRGYDRRSYRIDTRLVSRGSKFHPLLARDGFRGASTCKKLGIELYEIADLYYNPHMLTLVKTGHADIAKFYLGDYRKIDDYWPSLKVAFRNGYHIVSLPIWHDHIDLLKELGMDTHSPKYVCPYNLDYEHEVLIRRAGKVRALKRSADERKRIAEGERKYRDRIKAYLGIVFNDGNVIIRPIPTVQDVYDEAEAMHHCVYMNRYHEKPDSLLLSARTKDGVRLETIEVSLKNYSVLQSRARYNGETSEHDHIVRMMNAHMQEIRQCSKQKHAV